MYTLQAGIWRKESNLGSVGAISLGTSVTTGASANTKGTVVQLIASTAFDAHLVAITATAMAASAVSSACAIDILIGAATERILIPDLLAGEAGQIGINTGQKSWLFPLYVPAGSRISACAAGERTSQAFNIGIELWGAPGCPPFRIGTEVTTYGMGTTPNGTAITPGASAAEGSWTQIVATTSKDHFCLVPSLQMNSTTTAAGRGYSVDLGIGAAAAEVEIGGPYNFCSDTAESMAGPTSPWPTIVDVPSGSRLSMRVSCSGTITSMTYNAAIHAVN